MRSCLSPLTGGRPYREHWRVARDGSMCCWKRRGRASEGSQVMFFVRQDTITGCERVNKFPRGRLDVGGLESVNWKAEVVRVRPAESLAITQTQALGPRLRPLLNETMSQSPTTSTDTFDHQPQKRRRTTSFTPNGQPYPNNPQGMPPAQDPNSPAPPPSSSPVHIPKRGARACTNCRKGKNRCEGEVSVIEILSTRPPFRSTTGPHHPPGPAHSCFNRLLVVDASLVALNVYSKSQRRKMCKPCLQPASSESPDISR